MLTHHRTIEVVGACGPVLDYLADVRTVPQWHPRLTDVRMVEGAGDAGTRYDCVLHGLGRRDPMLWTVWRRTPAALVQSGESAWLRVVETFVLRERSAVTTVGFVTSYDVVTRPRRAPDAVVHRMLRRWSDASARALRDCLDAHLTALHPMG